MDDFDRVMKPEFYSGMWDNTLSKHYQKVRETKNTKIIKVGEVIYRPNGHVPAIVIEVDANSEYLKLLYFNGNTSICYGAWVWKSREIKRPSETKCQTKEEPNMTNTTKLYQIIGTETYGTHIATNSKGAYVLEMKGDGSVVTKTKGQLEEVVPYTVSLKYLSGGNSSEYAYFSQENVVKVGDLVLVGSGMAMITAVNTRSTKATKDLVGEVVVTKKVGE